MQFENGQKLSSGDGVQPRKTYEKMAPTGTLAFQLLSCGMMIGRMMINIGIGSINPQWLTLILIILILRYLRHDHRTAAAACSTIGPSQIIIHHILLLIVTLVTLVYSCYSCYTRMYSYSCYSLSLVGA